VEAQVIFEATNHRLKNLPLMHKPFSGALQRYLFSAGNLVSMGLSGFALIWSSAQ
jgi:hypothetical protein